MSFTLDVSLYATMVSRVTCEVSVDALNVPPGPIAAVHSPHAPLDTAPSATTSWYSTWVSGLLSTRALRAKARLVWIICSRDCVGAAVGVALGSSVGAMDGLAVGGKDGTVLGATEGRKDGSAEETGDGFAVGTKLGMALGTADGTYEGATVGGLVSSGCVGLLVCVGLVVGDTDGVDDGATVGAAEGVADGARVGVTVGLKDGLAVGSHVGV
jgi:hypothetical protein